MSPKVIAWIANHLLGEGENRKKAIAAIKENPKGALFFIEARLDNLVQKACINTGEVIFINDYEKSAKEIFEFCKKLSEADAKVVPA